MIARALIYIERGRSFLDAADVLIEERDRFRDEPFQPVATLLLFAIEISLKAGLYSAKAPVKNGHDIAHYLIEAIQHGLVISAEVAAGVFNVAEPYRLHGPRYAPLENAVVVMPPLSEMQKVARDVVDRSAAMIFGEKDQPQFKPLSVTEAEALRDRVLAAYKVNIQNFNPNMVWEGDNLPPIPLGTRTITALTKL